MTMEPERNQIYRMDCIELLSQVPDGYVSMILTDPPYGIRYQNNFARCPHPPIIGDSGIDCDRTGYLRKRDTAGQAGETMENQRRGAGNG